MLSLSTEQELQYRTLMQELKVNMVNPPIKEKVIQTYLKHQEELKPLALKALEYYHNPIANRSKAEYLAAEAKARDIKEGRGVMYNG